MNDNVNMERMSEIKAKVVDSLTNELDTYRQSFGFQGSYTTKHEFEFNTDLSYDFYVGYSEGYGRPEWQWNAEVNKSIGAFNLSLKVRDILN